MSTWTLTDAQWVWMEGPLPHSLWNSKVKRGIGNKLYVDAVL